MRDAVAQRIMKGEEVRLLYGFAKTQRDIFNYDVSIVGPVTVLVQHYLACLKRMDKFNGRQWRCSSCFEKAHIESASALSCFIRVFKRALYGFY